MNAYGLVTVHLNMAEQRLIEVIVVQKAMHDSCLTMLLYCEVSSRLIDMFGSS
jgi:hypothetical protein